MYHSKREKHNLFNLKKHANKHNIKHYNKQKQEYIKKSRNKFVDMFQNIISGCQYNEFKIDSKIHYNKFKYARVVPKGKKGYVWFQSLHNYNSCISPILYFERFKNNLQMLDNGTTYNICCEQEDINVGNNGTVLYGTFFQHNNTSYFNIENIYYYKNKNVSKYDWMKKFKVINELFLYYIKQISYTSNDLVLINCFTKKLPYDINTMKNQVPYDIFRIQYLSNSYNKLFYKQEYEKNKVEIFDIKASLNHDEYDIYSKDTKKYVNKLYVPDYKTSVYLNNIFRTIKENTNLDLLEESDDDEEFENISLDKFVDLQKSYRVKCIFDKNIKMWKLHK